MGTNAQTLSEPFSQLFRVWDQRRNGVAVPTRLIRPPAGMIELMPHIMVLERAGDGDGDIMVRYFGTALVAHMDTDPTGRSLLDLAPPAIHAAVEHNWKSVTETPCGLYGVFEVIYPSGVIDHITGLHLPMRNFQTGALQVVSVLEPRRQLHLRSAGTGSSASIRNLTVEIIDVGAGSPKLAEFSTL